MQGVVEVGEELAGILTQEGFRMDDNAAGKRKMLLTVFLFAYLSFNLYNTSIHYLFSILNNGPTI